MPFGSLLNVRTALAVSALAVSATVLTTAPLTAQDALQQQAARDFNAAAVLQNNGVYGRAEMRWTEFIQKYPKHANLDAAHDSLGVCQLHGKKYAEAIKTFEGVIARFKNYKQLDAVRYNLAMARFQLAGESGDANQLKQAAAAFADAVAKHPQSRHADKARYFQAESLYAAGDLEGAVAAYRQLIKSHPQSPLLGDAFYALGTTLQEQIEHQQAADVFAQFLDNKTLAAQELAREIQLRLGLSLMQLGKLPEAEARLAEAGKAENFPLADYALLQQGVCRMEQGKHTEAGAVFADLLKRFPQSPYAAAAQLAWGKSLLLADKLEDARKQLAPVAAADTSEAAEASYWLARTLLKQQKPADALALLDSALAKHKASPHAAHLEIARIDALYELPERRKETPPLYDAFAKQHADHPLAPQAAYMAGLAALTLEDYKSAQQFGATFLANPVLAATPLTPEVMFIAAEATLLVAASEQGGDLAQAEALYRKLVEQHPQHERVPRAQIRIGWCLLRAEQHDQAVQHLTAAVPQIKLPEDQAEAQLLIGRAHRGAGRDKEAVAAYDAGLKAKPDWPRRDELLIGAAESQRALEDLAGAAARLTQLRSQLAESSLLPQAVYLLGEIGQQQGQHDQAIQHFGEVTTKHADSEFCAPALYGLGAAHFAKDAHQAALAPLDELISKHPDSDSARRGRYLRGLARQRLGQHEPAIGDFEAFLAANPQGEEALDAAYAAALCRIELKQWPPAIERLQALAKDSDYRHGDKVLYELGHCLLSTDKPEEAVAAFTTLGKQHPDSPLAAEGFFHVGRHHEQLAQAAAEAAQEKPQAEQLAQAEQAFNAGLEKATDKPLREKLRYKLADVQFRQQKYAPAAATLTAQLGELPEGELAGPARFLAGECLFRQDKPQEALPMYVRVAADKVEKYHAQALYRAGECASRLQNWPESQKHFAALLQQFPKFPQLSEARYGLGVALQKQNQLAPAREAFEQVTRETEAETAAKARFMIGEIAFAEKKYEEAVEHFLRVVVGYAYPEWRALAQFEAARCFIELDRKPQAIQALETVVSEYPNHPKAKDAATLIEKLKT